MMDQASNYHPKVHFLAILTAVITCGLIYAGGLVTTIGAGMIFPDWPLSNDSFNPANWWRTPEQREEHGHRLIGAVVGLLTIALWVSVRAAGMPKYVRRLASYALAGVIIQGLLGGLRVVLVSLDFAIIHGCVGQLFFCLLVALACVTSRGWQQAPAGRHWETGTKVAVVLTAAVVLQLVLGALVRHHEAWSAIPTFPLVDGGIWPAAWNFEVAVHYLHRLGALVIGVLVCVLGFQAVTQFAWRARMFAVTTLSMIILQICLGAGIIMTQRHVLVTTSHVLLGAIVLACSLLTALWLWHGEEATADSA